MIRLLGLMAFLCVYQSYWEFLREGVMTDEHYPPLSFPPSHWKGFNDSYVALIPKKTGAMELRDYRPINLVSGVY